VKTQLNTIDNDPFTYVRTNFDVCVVASFGVKLPAALINSFPYPPVNLHPSLLPAYRGAAPIQHTLIRGEHTTGITLLTLHPTTFDAGRILYSESVVRMLTNLLPCFRLIVVIAFISNLCLLFML
jgi:methionyl-tRNA formyltransferase